MRETLGHCSKKEYVTLKADLYIYIYIFAFVITFLIIFFICCSATVSHILLVPFFIVPSLVPCDVDLNWLLLYGW